MQLVTAGDIPILVKKNRLTPTLPFLKASTFFAQLCIFFPQLTVFSRKLTAFSSFLFELFF